MNMLLVQFGLLFFLLQRPTPTPSPSPPPPEPPKPTVNISLARTVVRESDCVPVEVWFSNEGAQEIKSVALQIASPEFFRWSLQPCGVADAGPVPSVSLAAASATGQPALNSVFSRKIYLKTGPHIDVGDHNLLFSFRYVWQAGKEARQSFAASEKTIKANFLGSESVAGVPLGLAGLIVPGLFFWLVVRGLGVAWGTETPLGDKLIYSVVVSFIFVALASALVGYFPWLRYLDISSGISVRKLIWLAGTGVGVGLAVGLIDYLRRRKAVARAAERELNFSDTPNDVVRKLLGKSSTYNPSALSRLFGRISRKNFGGYKPQTLVKLKNGQVYAGSLGEKGPDLTMLAGWFKVTQDQAKPDAAKLESLRAEGRLFELIKLAQSGDFAVTVRNRVKQVNDGQIVSTANSTMVWPSGDVLQVVVERGGSDDEAVTLAQP